MKTSTPSCSAFAQNGWNFGSLISSPLTLPPMPAPRSPYFLTPSSSCWAARSGCCSATVAKATKRSGCAAHASASFSFWSLMSWLATSRSALYQYGLMLSASTSMPCSSIARIRSDACVAMCSSGGSVEPGVDSFIPIRAMASGTAQCACTSTVLTRRPPTITSRRRAWARAGAAARRSQPTNAIPASEAAREAEHLKQQVSTLQARLHAREELAAARAAASSPDARVPPAPRASGDRGLTAAVREERLLQDLRARGGAAAERPASSRSGPSGPPTVDVALDRFYRYLEATRATEGRERWQRARELVEELRGMGDGAGSALSKVLAAG